MSPAGAVGPLDATTSEASWFCCGAAWGPCAAAGGGACGNCDSKSMQCAWPNTSASCLSITQPGDCGLDVLSWDCGHTFYVEGLCNSANITVKIADCGPHTNEWCGEQHCCGGKCGTNRLIDLTPAAYSKLASLSTGLTAVSIHS